MIRACIFDLDGVIVDTARYHFLAWRRLARELGFDLTEEQNERLKGVSRMHSLDILLELGNQTRSIEERESLATRKNGWFVEYLEQMKPDEVFPGVLDLIWKFKRKGIRVGLASSSKNARRVVQLLGIEEYFQAIVDGNMITHSKPDPEIFLLAAHKLSVAPRECLVFEDAEAGVEAAVAAGMKCVGVGSPELLHKAGIVIQKTGDFDIAMLKDLDAVH